jgi:PEP-CTERM motif
VSGTAPWTLGTDVNPVVGANPDITVTIFNLAALPDSSFFNVNSSNTTPFVEVVGSLSSSTGATIDGGGLTFFFSPYIADAAFGPGGASTIDYTFQPTHEIEGVAVSGTWSLGPTTVTPEPSSVLMLGLGLAGAGGLAWRRRKSR